MKHSTTPFVSGKNPCPYSIENGAFFIENGPLSFNRSLYGGISPLSYGRLKAVGGDRPEFMFYLNRRLGYLFFGVSKDGKIFPASAFDRRRMYFKNGTLFYSLEDREYGKFTAVFAVKRGNLGAELTVKAERRKEGTELCVFFGGMDGKKDSREMDAGYTAEEKTVFRASLCAGTRFEPLENGFRAFHDMVPYTASFYAEKSCHGQIIDAEGYLLGEIRPGTDMAMISCPDDCIKAGIVFETEQAAIPEREEQIEKISVQTPSPLINAAMDAVRYAVNGAWSEPFFLHGAWSWGIPLLGWRSRYGSTCFGWYDRVKTEGYTYYSMQYRPERKAKQQAHTALYSSYFTNPSDNVAKFDNQSPDADPAWRLSRQSQKSIFNSAGVMPYTPGKDGIVQYDMQEVFMDQMLFQCRYERDENFYRETLEALKYHIDWQKRCFDSDNDNLYENFANFWASDSIFQSGAGCSIATAYNYRACRMAAELCRCLGEDGTPYEQLAEQIHSAFLKKLWLTPEGHMAECIDTYGECLVHPSASLPTVVHCAESGLLDEKMLYQALRYTKTFLQREQTEDGELIWNTQWAPYRWSVRDIDFADVFHGALSFFLAGDGAEGMKLLSGALGQSCLRNIAPGGFMCVQEGKSIDFSDTSSMAARAVIEGLFGIRPQRHLGFVVISPSFPEQWNNAELNTCDYSLSFHRNGREEIWEARMESPEAICFQVPLQWEKIEDIICNGSSVPYTVKPGVGQCRIYVQAGTKEKNILHIRCSGQRLSLSPIRKEFDANDEITFYIPLKDCELIEIDDPQGIISEIRQADGALRIIGKGTSGAHSFFLHLRQGSAEYWRAVDLTINPLPKQPVKACTAYQALDLRPFMTGRIGDLFRRKYLIPRPQSCSLQVPDSLYPPTWCVLQQDDVEQMNDRLICQQVKNGIFDAFGIPFVQDGDESYPNAVLISHWEQDSCEVSIPVGESADQICLLLACYTNQMQCHVPNVEITLTYSAGEEIISLQAPDQIRPFYVGPEGERECDQSCYGGETVRRIRIGDKNEREGIYAQVWQHDLLLQKLEIVKIRAVANDVVIGVMGMTLGYCR